MDTNTKEVWGDLMIVFIIICCIAGCVSCYYIKNNNCDRNCKSKTEQVKLND